MPARETVGRRTVIHLSVFLAVTVTSAYLVWRAAATLDGSALVLSAPLLLLEIHSAISLVLHSLNLWDLDAGPVPDAGGGDVQNLRIAVLIPTCNEPREILLPTVAAAVALDPAHETWVLDDGNRAWVAELASALGARYHARDSAEHAKAGNLNAALALPDLLDVEIVAVLDADHVARRDFLTATLPYFADPRLALVQTPQDFYNLDSFEHVRRARGRRYMEQELFYRALAAGRNRWNSAFWCGTGALLRVVALREVGGVATETLTEDIHTTLKLHRRGWRSVYHNEVLARGLAAADPGQYMTQRVRWGTGAMQVLRGDNPLLGRGLTLTQRLSYLETLLGWFDAWRTLGFLLLPPATLLIGGLPINAPAGEFVPWFVSAFATQRIALRLLARGRAPLLQALMFELVRMPANLLATTALFSRTRRRFVVTSKGRTGQTRARARVPRLIALLVLLSLGSLAVATLSLTGQGPVRYPTPWVAYGATGWCLVNLALLTTAIRRLRHPDYAADRRAALRFDVEGEVLVDRRPALLRDVSLTGMSILLPADSADPADGIDPGTWDWSSGRTVLAELDLPHGSLSIQATIRSVVARPEGLLVGLDLHRMGTADQAALAVALFRTGLTPRLVGSGEAAETLSVPARPR